MMICPGCGAEYREGFNQCVDCGAALTVAPPDDEPGRWEHAADATAGAGPAPPPPDRDIVLVPVFETGNPYLISLARSLLDSAGIEHATRGLGVRSVFGLGHVLLDWDVFTGPVVFLVREADAADAAALLKDLREGPRAPDPREPGPPAPDSASS